MIRRQPDHLNCPSTYPFFPSNPFPFKSSSLPTQPPRVAARPAGLYSAADEQSPAGKSVLLCQKAAQERHTNRRVCGWLAYRSRGPWCYETPGHTSCAISRNQFPERVETLCGEHELRMCRREHNPEHLICSRRRRESSSSSIEGHLKHRYERIKCD